MVTSCWLPSARVIGLRSRPRNRPPQGPRAARTGAETPSLPSLLSLLSWQGWPAGRRSRASASLATTRAFQAVPISQDYLRGAARGRPATRLLVATVSGGLITPNGKYFRADQLPTRGPAFPTAPTSCSWKASSFNGGSPDAGAAAA